MSNDEIVIPPRPDGGYPDEFFASWNLDEPERFAAWFMAYHQATGDESGDLDRWMDRIAHSISVYRNGKPTVMRTTSVRLPEDMIERAKREGARLPSGQSGVIREALAEHWARQDRAS